MKENIRFTLEDGVSFIISRLSLAGHRADIVGGSVRNMLLGIPVSDYDITTSARPEQIKSVFSDLRTIDTGIQHGTVTVMLDGTPYEVTTYRVDGEYDDNRHPRCVEFSGSLAEDLRRRDFTVNAMCYSDEWGLTDLFDGVGDLEKRIIRAVGNPEERFLEDGLRILRALRFASVLDFEIEENTDKAIRKQKDLISNISKERILAELKKLIAGKGAYAILNSYPEVISVSLPEIYTNGLPTKESFEALSDLDRLVALFVNLSPRAPSAFERALLFLKSDKASIKLGREALEVYSVADFSTKSAICRMLNKYSIEAVYLAARIRRAFSVAAFDEKKALDEALATEPVYKISHLKIDGNDLSLLGFSGKRIGDTLSILLSLVIDGECPNERDALMQKAGEYI